MKPEVQQILDAMKDDPRIKAIVLQIIRMSSEERENFRKKVTYYFMNKNSEVDVEAFKFFKVVLENIEELSEAIEQE
ncbi:hypothetical protein [Thermotoga neapolitana]|jgi:predicted metal-binding transcription factor (methanogenesis marker protein 9)|uniref:Uncharacterized protein n=1 Tax=Thermotoga neapolitana (strain ATCC 49049 / DSM 4359 / NBRC 107923 / NS-E) TaxID=309803 RepID=B9KA70_THENN|nr:hypothetical protein [Thermotoga neapolitana]MDK2786042.1 hypothetical protein [Thermotoga sp.]ACM23853.1 Putative uncharacterized protein [Thermotoga neapolitana DSM 4359]KFZ21048.1 hypothetical protein LA10_08908 [Thermotoga neapolitana LA10]MDK2949507.1 hypothetical protein [Thermotoga sp.]HBF10731.1 hypothetical protein [Thermotoga neapolitana]